jgi:hypothetical protein
MSVSMLSPEDQAKARAEAQQAAREAEERRIKAYGEQRGDTIKLDWVMSNRVDNRVVLHERDERHPGGECFIGGGGPDFCAHTEEVDNLIRNGVVLVVPEPQDGRKKPLVQQVVATTVAGTDAPGEPTRLGRKVDPELFGESGVKQVEKAQEKLPDEVPVPGEVEKPADADTPTGRTANARGNAR